MAAQYTQNFSLRRDSIDMIKSFTGQRGLVTGADGFIGSHLVERLAELGADLYCIVEPDSDCWRLRDIERKITILRYDICDSKLKNVIKKISPQKVFHLASFVESARDVSLTKAMFKINLLGTVNLMDSLKDLGCDVIINTGTCEEYGNNTAPFKETDLPRPVSPYSASKTASTFYCQMLWNSFKMPIVTLRPFLTYGPKQSTNLFIPSLIDACLRGEDFEMTKGEQTREVNYVSDIVDGFILAGCKNKAIGKIINIGCGRDYKIKDIAEKIIDFTGAHIKLKTGKLSYRAGEVKRFYCDNTLAKKALGWKAKIKLNEGLKRTIEWYKKNRS